MHVCVLRHWRGWGQKGEWTFKSVFEASFPRLWKKEHRDIFWHKKSRHAKFQWIPRNLKNRNEIGTFTSLPRSHSIIFDRNSTCLSTKMMVSRTCYHKLISCMSIPSYQAHGWLKGVVASASKIPVSYYLLSLLHPNLQPSSPEDIFTICYTSGTTGMLWWASKL